MLRNPFTPSEIASAPDDFFGRTDELRTLERSLRLGSVAIQGPIGIGKSSLLARGRLVMEGFGTDHRAKSVVAVADKNVKTIDDAARLLLECFVDVDERQSRLRFKLGPVLEIEAGDVTKFFAEGRHLAALKRLLEEEYLKRVLANGEMLVLAIDEADKAPVALAQLIRSLVTQTQHHVIKHVRFIIAGVSPFFQEMVNEDSGLNRFFYKTITLQPMGHDDAMDLISTKLDRVEEFAEEDEIELRVQPSIIPRVALLSGGHPHLLQLLGSHLVEHEDDDPDGIIDERDMTNALRRICYEDRARVYTATLHKLELHGHLDDFLQLIRMDSPGLPTSVNRSRAVEAIGESAIQWLVDHNILALRARHEYGLIDEFLRIRLILDSAEGPSDEARIERQLIEAAGDDRASLIDDSQDMFKLPEED